ncbi:snRNA-activating protein complex subunit 1-like isoform X4 [Ranitomeya variabilis]|uniref:snRNA-activating protein complex subunit 1-like isoform X4 n=1 Tax=Ranitomeya variabilis TaxID=490064 RepID=UPI004056141B
MARTQIPHHILWWDEESGVYPVHKGSTLRGLNLFPSTVHISDQSGGHVLAVWSVQHAALSAQAEACSWILCNCTLNNKNCQELIRLSLKDWADVEHLHRELISAQHLDAVYIFRQMRRMRAFYFTAMPTMLTFKSQKSIQLEVSKEEFLEKKDRVADLITSESLEEIMNIQEHYQKTKCNLSSGKSQPNKTLNLIKEDCTDSLQSLVEGYQFWQQEKRAPRTNTDDEQEGTSQESESSERARHLAQIKSKTYSAVTQAVKSRRHRQVEMLTSSAEAGVCLPVTRAERTRLSRARKRAEREAAKKAQTPLPQRKPEKMPVIPEEDSSSSSEDVPASKRQRKDEDSPSWLLSGYS